MTWNYRYVIATLILLGIFAAALFMSQEDAASSVPGAGIGISWKSFNEGVSLARESNKKIVVDVYTDWCSWCKKMDSEVYTNPEVIKTLNRDFVAIKLNAESADPVEYNGKTFTQAQFAQELGVTGYPTILFFDSHASPITSLSGYSPAPRFQKVLEYVGQEQYKKVSFQQFLEE